MYSLVVANRVFNRSNRDAFSGFRIYRETLSRFSCAASTGIGSGMLRRRLPVASVWLTLPVAKE
ncbi:hypothetical protein ACB371_10530, partial [Klebsiella pneumoniae]